MRRDQREPALPQIQKMLGRAAANRIARASGERRRRGSGFAIFGVVALLLGGSAMAATGVWSPFGKDGPQGKEIGRSSVGAGMSGDGSASGQAPRPVSPGVSGRRTRDQVHPLPLATSFQLDESPVGQPADRLPEPEAADTPSGTAIGVESQPRLEDNDAGGDDTDAPSLETPAGAPDPPAAPPAPPGTGKRTVTLTCLDKEVEVGQQTKCIVTVGGGPSAPTGTASFATGPGGVLEPPVCTLADNGDGTASCASAYTPTAKGTHQLIAGYDGDGTESNFFFIEGL